MSIKILKIAFLSLVLIVLFTSCKKIENRETTNIELVN